MKQGKNKLVLAALAVFIVSIMAGIQAAYPNGPGDIRNSKHNLSRNANPTGIHAQTVDEVCVFCHTPHRSMSAGPLWNHSLSNRSSYTLYSSPKLLSPAPSGSKPDGDSLLCLSCHDGDRPVGAVQNIGGQTTTITMVGPRLDAQGRLIGAASFGGDLSGHHPISIEMNACLVNDKASFNPGGCPDPEVSWKVQIPPADYMRPTANRYGTPCSQGGGNTGKGVQCSSCHDAHSSAAKFLRTGSPGSWSTNYSDTLCLVCHVAC